MTDLLTLTTMNLLAVSFGVGIIIGLTGMGGGALMTPALIFLNVPPAAAVANDLVAAAKPWTTASLNGECRRYCLVRSGDCLSV